MANYLIDYYQKLHEEHDIAFVSIDVFDTLIFRRTACPEDVFALAYEIALSQLDIKETISATEFKTLRQHAEKNARQHAFSDDVSLKAIYDELPFTDTTKQILKAAELQAESEVTFINQDVLDLIVFLKKNHVHIAFISDMYLSSSDIQLCIFKHHEVLGSIPLYVSSEFGETKATGALYQTIKARHNLEFTHWFHIGDNWKSDYENATLFGIHAFHYAPSLDYKLIQKIELEKFDTCARNNTIRALSCLSGLNSPSPIAFQIATYVWGPAFLSFIDWVIDSLLQKNIKTLLCLMREAELFYPLISLRLRQRNIRTIKVIKFYASRLSTFWPSINIDKGRFISEVIDILVSRPEYTIGNLYTDLQLDMPATLECYANTEMVSISSTITEQGSLLSLLTQALESDKSSIYASLRNKKVKFAQYFASSCPSSLEECAVLDFGNGGTIQHQLERAIGKRAGANLLFVASERIYRYTDSTYFQSFIGLHNDCNNAVISLWRCAAAIEAFLTGCVGSTLGYRNGEPTLGQGVPENEAMFNSFLRGCEHFFVKSDQYQFEALRPDTVAKILMRFVHYPTLDEAKLYKALVHAENFGSEKQTPIVDHRQLSEIQQIGIERVYTAVKSNPFYLMGRVYWPQAAITVLDPDFIVEREGVKSNKVVRQAERLLKKVSHLHWDKFAVYGAGEFFEAFYQLSDGIGFDIELIIDRKAEINGDYQLHGITVTSLKNAIERDCKKFVVASSAFSKQISQAICEVAKKSNKQDEIEIVVI